jgi:hypothetical protein
LVEALAKDGETEAALADRERLEEVAMSRGVSGSVRYVRVAAVTPLTASGRSIESFDRLRSRFDG